MKKLSLVLATALVAPGALAEPLADSPQPAQAAPEAPLAVLVPLSLRGSTDGDSEFKAGGGLAFALNPRWDLSTLASYRIKTSNGLAELVSIDSDDVDAPPWWQLALSVSFTRVSRMGMSHEVPNEPARKAAAYDACKDFCGKNETEETKAFCSKSKELLNELRTAWAKKSVDVLSDNALCAGKQEDVGKLAKRRDEELLQCATDECRKTAHLRYSERKVLLLLDCAKDCDAGPVLSADPKFCDRSGLPLSPKPEQFSADEFCPAGQETWKQDEQPHRTERFAPFAIDLGARVGTQDFAYRAAGADSLLTEVENTHTAWAAGGSAYGLLGDAGSWIPYVEGQLLFKSSWTASKDSVQWCSPAGNVARSDDSDAVDAAETCSKATLEGPSQKRELQAIAYLGWLENAHGRFRGGFGPEVLVPMGDDPRSLEIGAALPMTLALATLSSDLQYNGLLQITPRATWTIPDEGDAEFRATVTLTLLGQRLLFSEEFDEL